MSHDGCVSQSRSELRLLGNHLPKSSQIWIHPIKFKLLPPIHYPTTPTQYQRSVGAHADYQQKKSTTRMMTFQRHNNRRRRGVGQRKKKVKRCPRHTPIAVSALTPISRTHSPNSIVSRRCQKHYQQMQQQKKSLSTWEKSCYERS